MDKEALIKKACYLVDLIEDALAAVESCKPAESLPLYHYKPEEYTPAEDTLAMVKKAFGKPRFLEIAFNSMEQYYKIGKIMLDTSFDKYGRGKDWFQHNNYDLIVYDFLDTFVSLYSIAKAELHTRKATPKTAEEDLQFRFHRGGVTESLNTLFKPKSWDDFVKQCAACGFETSSITTKLYDSRPDTRVGWKETWIVCNANGPIGYANGNISALRK